MTGNSEAPIAYLTGEYPKASHTFIQREIAALRDHGAVVDVSAIRRPGSADITGPEEQAAQSETFFVLARAKNPIHLLGSHLALLGRNPLRWIRTLTLALKSGRPGLRGLLWQVFYFLEAGVLARHLQRRKAAHLHNHFGDSSASVAMLTAKLANIPFSFTLHGPAEFFAPEAWRLDIKAANAAFVVCITHFCRSQAMIFSDPEHWDKFKIVHCGVSPERYGFEPATTEGPLQFLFVGRLTPLKGLRVLFAAFEKVRSERPGITLKVIGDGPDRAWADAEAARIGGIKMLGFQSQDTVAEELSAADALVLPSFAEGLPVVFMEALAAARPVIASRVAGVGELVVEGETGLLVSPGDQAGLEQALFKLCDTPQLRKDMGLAGRRRVQNEFNSLTEAQWLLTLFRSGGRENKLRP